VELLPAALFLVPGAVASLAHRFASAQSLSNVAQLLLAAAYSGVVYALLGTPLASWLVTPEFPTDLFTPDATSIANPAIAARLLLVSTAAGALGLAVGRASMSRRIQLGLTQLTGRNLYSTVWVETFRNASRQWVRLKSDRMELIGWLESASDTAEERSLLLSHVHEVRDRRLLPIVGRLLLVRLDDFPTVVLLGRDVKAELSRARTRARDLERAAPPDG
jgi:uncharacterized protein DUF6338